MQYQINNRQTAPRPHFMGTPLPRERFVLRDNIANLAVGGSTFVPGEDIVISINSIALHQAKKLGRKFRVRRAFDGVFGVRVNRIA